MARLGVDPHSYANFHEILTQSLSLNLRVDFARKILLGYVDVSADVLRDGALEMSLDVKQLAIESVMDLQSSAFLPFTLPSHHHVLGMRLCVPLPDNCRQKGSVFRFRVCYSTTEHSSGIQWLEPSQTSGKGHPLMYTQCQAILARTLLPCQDTPAVKCKYDAKISCAPPLVAVCSGREVGPVRFEDDGYVTYTYQQPVPIPSYLIAIVCGRLEKGTLGPRCAVWSERELLEASVSEFKVDTEKYLQIAEKITGIPYDWGIYDLVVLPGSFPYGGMENPNLTFLNRSLVVGDRSLSNVVAHEITHSWAGNLVTNSNWSDFWLNEGFTVYIERLILGELHGVTYRHFEILVGYKDLIKTIDEEKEKEFTKLAPNMDEIDPDEAFSKVPYEKGSLFLLHLEFLVGGVDKMRAWLRKYFEDFRGKSVDFQIMKDHFCTFFSASGVSAETLQSIDWQRWVYAPGPPPLNPHADPRIDKTMIKRCEELSQQWMEGKAASPKDLDGLQTRQVMYALDGLLTSPQPPSSDVVEHLDKVYHWSHSSNAEIAYRFILLCLRSGCLEKGVALADDFLGTYGRGLYVKPIYTTLANLDQEKAKHLYSKHRSYHHSVVRNMCVKLGLGHQ